MSLLDRLFGSLPAALRAPLGSQSWLVVDVETSGLNVKTDHLLAIGAVLVEAHCVPLAQSFEVVLKPPTPSQHDNILVHRITSGEQMAGVDPATALTTFREVAKNYPCVAFHADFDEAMLKRAFRAHLNVDFSPPFVDLALLAPALLRDAPRRLASLDDWLLHVGVVIGERHRAAADALGTAQLFQILLSEARRQQIASAAALFKLAAHQRWLSRQTQ